MSRIEYTENPTEQDFPLIDRCVVCDGYCEWQPRYEIALRSAEHKAILAAKRLLSYVPDARVVKICAECCPDDNDELRRMIRRLYPVYATAKGI